MIDAGRALGTDEIGQFRALGIRYQWTFMPEEKLLKKMIFAFGLSVSVGAAVLLAPGVAQATQACTTLHSPNNGGAAMCKSWFDPDHDGLYFGEWWQNGGSTAGVFLMKVEDGRPSRAGFQGSYADVAVFRLKLCDALTGKCGTPW